MSYAANLFVAPAAPLRFAALLALLAIAAACDWRSHRIPNALTLPAALLGVTLAATGIGTGPSASASLAGAAIAFALMAPLHALRTTGAGDVKLMVAAGTFLGPLDAAFAVLFTFIAGGVLALAWAAWHRSLMRLIGNLGPAVHASLAKLPPAAAPSVGRMPYALAISAGTLACVALRHPFAL